MRDTRTHGFPASVGLTKARLNYKNLIDYVIKMFYSLLVYKSSVICIVTQIPEAFSAVPLLSFMVLLT